MLGFGRFSFVCMCCSRKKILEEWNVVFRLEGHAHESCSCRNIGHKGNLFPEFIIDLPSFTSFLDTLLGRPMATKPFRRPIHWILCQRLYMYIKHLTSERGSVKPFHGQGATPSKALFTAMNKSQPWFLRRAWEQFSERQ